MPPWVEYVLGFVILIVTCVASVSAGLAVATANKKHKDEA